MKENNKKKGMGRLLRLGAMALAAVLAWQVITPPMARVIGALAEDGGALSKIYGILSDSVGEPTTARDYYELANISIGKGEYEKALQELESARNLVPMSEITDIEKQTPVGQNNDEKQTEVEETGKPLDENQLLLAELWLKTASVYILTDCVEDAQKALNNALAINPASAQALLLRSQLSIETQDYRSAITDLEKYLETNAADTTSRLTLAQLLESIADYKGAIAQYELLYKQVPTDESYQLNALRCSFLAGYYEDAIAGFDAYKLRHEGEEADPFGGIADFLRAASLMQLGDYAAAADGFADASAAGYDRAACLEQITLCRFETGEYEAVIAAGEEIFAMPGAVVSAPALVHQRMGISSMRLGDYEGALASMDKVKEIDPGLDGNEYYRGVCLLSLNRQAEAVDAFTASIDANYLPQFCYYNRGVCYVDLLEYEKAIEDMAKTIESGDDQDLIAAAKDILWQLAAYFEQVNAQTPATESAE